MIVNPKFLPVSFSKRALPMATDKLQYSAACCFAESNWSVCLTTVCVCVSVCAGFELLYQPEVVRLYLSLLTESQNYNTLEAAAGALQNLSAGQWTVSLGLGRVNMQTGSTCSQSVAWQKS